MGTLNDLCGLYSLLCYRSDEIIGSGSIATYNEKFFLLTCCHNFLAKDDAHQLKELEDDVVEQKIKRNCKKAQYCDFESRDVVSAHVVLKNYENPKLVVIKVGTIAYPLSCREYVYTVHLWCMGLAPIMGMQGWNEC